MEFGAHLPQLFKSSIVSYEDKKPLAFGTTQVWINDNNVFISVPLRAERERGRERDETYGWKGMKYCFSSSHSIFPLMMSLMSITVNGDRNISQSELMWWCHEPAWLLCHVKTIFHCQRRPEVKVLSDNMDS